MQRPLLSPLTALLFTLAFPIAANAQQAKESPPAEASDAHLRGLEIVARPTIGSLGGESPLVAKTNDPGKLPVALRPGATPYGLSPGIAAQIGYRFHPVVSAGLRGDAAMASVDAPDDGSTNNTRSRQSAGLYARAYPLALSESIRQHIDPWLSAGITYLHDGASFDHNEGGGVVKYQADTHSIGIPLGIGVDYRVTKWLSTGPSFEYVLMNPIAGCFKGTAASGKEERICTDEKNGEGLVAQAIGAWNVGLTLRVTPF